jgi:hypothetical protein
MNWETIGWGMLGAFLVIGLLIVASKLSDWYSDYKYQKKMREEEQDRRIEALERKL